MINSIRDFLEELDEYPEIEIIKSYLYGAHLRINGDLIIPIYYSGHQRQVKIVLPGSDIDIEEYYYPIESPGDVKIIYEAIMTRFTSDKGELLKEIPVSILPGKTVWRKYLNIKYPDQVLEIIYYVSDNKESVIVTVRDLKFDLPIQISYQYNFPKQVSGYREKYYVDGCIRKSLTKFRNGEVF